MALVLSPPLIKGIRHGILKSKSFVRRVTARHSFNMTLNTFRNFFRNRKVHPRSWNVEVNLLPGTVSDFSVASVMTTIIIGSIRPVLIVVRLTTSFFMTLTVPLRVFGTCILVLCTSLKDSLRNISLIISENGMFLSVRVKERTRPVGRTRARNWTIVRQSLGSSAVIVTVRHWSICRKDVTLKWPH